MTDWTELQAALAKTGYVASDDLAMALHIATALGRPILLEGAAGVGKTEVARALADVNDTALIRLLCYAPFSTHPFRLPFFPPSPSPTLVKGM